MIAILAGTLDVISLLLNHGADGSIRTKTGNTALMFAASTRLDVPEIVDILIKHRCQVNDVNKAGDSGTPPKITNFI